MFSSHSSSLPALAAAVALCAVRSHLSADAFSFHATTSATASRNTATRPTFLGHVTTALQSSSSSWTAGMFSDFDDDSSNKNANNLPFDYNDDDFISRRHTAEFQELEPILDSVRRKARKDLDEQARGQYVSYGNQLWDLRKQMQKLSSRLVAAINGGEHEQEERIRQALRQLERKDPELQYKLNLEAVQAAKAEGKLEEAELFGMRALAARNCLPQFNLDGLWVGKYGHHGYELINVTYVGDHLTAYKVTGDKNVPRGEITFQVDLSPFQMRSITAPSPPLQPIMLTDKAARKWGTDQLPRTRGLGQVAEQGFENHQWMEGQLIIIGEEYFSFAWVPIEQQIFFGRPSPELALKMLRESGASDVRTASLWEAPPSIDEDVSILKDYVASCLEKTSEAIEEDFTGDPFSCIWHGVEDECYFQ